MEQHTQELYSAIVELPPHMQLPVEAFLLEEYKGLSRINEMIMINSEYHLRRRGTPVPLEELRFKFYHTLHTLKLEYEKAIRECIASLPN